MARFQRRMLSLVPLVLDESASIILKDEKRRLAFP
jgi:hypothetical protein